MKKFLFTSMATITLLSLACNKSADDNPAGPDGNYEVNYKNRNLQGMINGAFWEYILGESNSSKGGWNSEYSHNFNIVDSAQSDSCLIIGGKRSKIIFALNDDFKLLSAGKYPLSLDFSTFEGRTVTLVSWTDSTVLNSIAYQGEYEILSVDTITQEIMGRMDAFYDNNNFVNGLFTVKYCYW